MSNRAVILAGGKGTRLKPYTVTIPKPLVPIGDHTILEIIIRQLVHHGFDHITLTVSHQAELIQAYFGKGERWKIKIDYSFEEKPLSTMGPLKLIKDLPENFLVMNGDILTNLSFSDFFDFHTKKQNLFTISTCFRELKSEYGVLEIDGNQLRGFQEKPTIKYDVSMGIYSVHKKVLDIIPKDQPYGFDHLMLDLIRKEKPASIYKFEGSWLDIGRPEDYAMAFDEFDTNKEIYLK